MFFLDFYKIETKFKLFFSFKLRNVVKMCLNLQPELRPNINQICQVATKMHQNFQAMGTMSPVTPSPMEMQQS